MQEKFMKEALKEAKKAYKKFMELVENQGGDITYIENTEKFPKAKFVGKVISDKEGFIEKIPAKEVGKIACYLGAGRERKEDKKDKAIITATIIVERDSLKSIIIGKQGKMLKNIGSKARQDIEKMVGKKVYLDLFVKTIKNWRDKEKYLRELGFYDISENEGE